MANYQSKNNIIYDLKTKQVELIFPNYQKQINFPKYEKLKKGNENKKNPSQLEIELK